jgi:hypothetical protein
MAKQRISYIPLEEMDAEMRREMERCQREGTPRPESSAIRAHVPACFWFFADSWNNIFRNGVLDHAIKELCRLYVSRSVECEYCQKAALAYAEAIAWHTPTDDAFWERMYRHYNEAELVELGCMIGLTLGQQSWLRLLNIDHHQVLAGTSASMAPGFEDASKLADTKASPQYWAKGAKSRSTA